MKHFIVVLRNPKSAAPLIAEMLGGEAMPLPPLSGCWIVFTPDDSGLEIHPDTLNRRPADTRPFSDDGDGAVATLGSRLPARRIVTLASKVGWPFRQSSSPAGEIIEVAVEGRHVLAIAAETERFPLAEMQ